MSADMSADTSCDMSCDKPSSSSLVSSGLRCPGRQRCFSVHSRRGPQTGGPGPRRGCGHGDIGEEGRAVPPHPERRLRTPKEMSGLLDQEEALKRLQQLEHEMVGGERATDETLKEKRRKKLKHAEVRKLQLAKAIAKMDDEGIMLNIYSSIEEELKVKNEILEKEKEKVHAAECEIVDLNAEFEFERIDYLDTIRKQEKQLALYQQLLEKVQPVLRRDCNYYNLDKVKSSCKWDEEEQNWSLPDLTITKDKLPDRLPPGAVTQGGRPAGLTNPRMTQPRNGYINGSSEVVVGARDYDEEDKYLQRLSKSNQDEQAMNYFKPKRANKLLGEADNNKNHRDPSMHGLTNGHTNDMMAASKHGQTAPEKPLRRPMRLEALPTGKSKKGKKKSQNSLEPL
ncbi:putative kinesin-like protein KIF17 [Apostichopus japonicus]|uniref:Putative kinesin-like protein KIF17 n=1 Tax=Stichopus japonicus TaxID=307972 RepID=A0A2G8KAJ6_STIJA|nr:putative kinesin-like protein KIF17 [Apostichopus japonicus]